MYTSYIYERYNLYRTKDLTPMTRHILTLITLIAAISFTPAMQTSARASIELGEVEAQQPKIVQKGNSIIVYGAAGRTVQVFNLIGVEIISIRPEAQQHRIDLSQQKKGIYVVKVGNVSKKVNISGR